MTIEQILEILENYKLRIPPTVFYDLKADIVNFEEPTTKNDLGVDCISRAQTQSEIEMNASRYTIAKERGGMGQVEWSDQLIKVSDAVDIIRNLPSVTPQEPKTGHWIVAKGSYLGMRNGCCSNCKDFYTNDWNVMNYCPHCGAKMVEPQESEDKCKNCKYYLNPDYTRCHECKAESER